MKDLTATRVGDEVHLHWTMPKETTDKVMLKGEQRAHFCWEREAPLAEKPAAAGKARSGKVGAPVPKIGPDHHRHSAAAQPRLQNHAGKTAGPSNAAWVATGAAPAGVTGLRLETRAAGVVLHWDGAAPQAKMVLRIHRTLVPKPAAAKSSGANGASPEQQVLEVDLDKADPGVALDHDAVLDHAWKYAVERVLKVEINQHALEIAGPPSKTETIDAIDLSWTPNTDADLAGYVVYRRDVTAGTAMERISGKSLVAPPSFGDTTVVAGHRYAYAVSAVDQDGNESARSGEVEEQIPQ